MTPLQVDGLAMLKARQLLIDEEGYRLDVYFDSLGKLTVGIGHLVLAKDNLRHGQKITDAQAKAFFNADIAKAFDAAREQAAELNKYTPNMIAALTSVNFQLGTNWKRDFGNTWLAIKSGSVDDAISRLKNSKWNRQTPARVASFISTLEREYA